MAESNKEEPLVEVAPAETVPVAPQNKIETTPDELEAYALIKIMLYDIIHPSRITYKDTVRYFSILVDAKSTKWICRVWLTSASKSIVFMEDEKEVRYTFDNINDLLNYKDKIVTSAKRYL